MASSRRLRAAAMATLAVPVLALPLVACGSGDADATLTGAVREPAPVVDATTLPSLAHPGQDVAFRARAGGLQVVYFGYTNCPDVCPTTMADLAVALRKLPDDQAQQVDTVMVTVDPDRDLDVLAGYVQSFIPDADAAGTTDAARLADAAEPFGVVYSVTTSDAGEVEVVHSGFLYVVNDRGELVLSWPFGATSDDIAADLSTLLDDGGVPA